MPSLVVNGAAQLRVIWSLEGQLAINVYGVNNSAGTVIDQALADRMGSGIKTNFTSSPIRPLLAATTELVAIGIRSLNAPGGNIEFFDAGAPVAGTGTTDPLPRATALVVTLRTAVASRSGRGRSYIGGWAEAENNAAAEASAADATAAVGWVNAIAAFLLSENLTMAVIQRPANAVVTTSVETLPDGTEITHTHVSAARAAAVRNIIRFECRDVQWDSQRRRNNGRGALAAGTFRPMASSAL